MTSDGVLTHDRFLDGRLQVWQPKSGYRAGTDAVLLAAGVNAQPGQSVLDIGCGVGVVSLCLATRVGSLKLTGLEVQTAYADLARRNGRENGVALDVVDGDLAEMPPALRAERFDHVVTNPPFFDAGHHTAPDDAGRRIAHQGQDITLKDWIGISARRVAPKGSLTVILPMASLPTVLRALPQGMGGIEIFPIAGRDGQAARRFVMSARAGSAAPFVMHAPLIMHDGVNHSGDFDDHSLKSVSILRNGASLR